MEGRTKISDEKQEKRRKNDEFLDVIYWSRQALGIIIGLLWGLIPLKGFVALLLFAVVNAGLIYLYFSNFQSVDEEEFGGPWELTKEGFMTSFAGFLFSKVIQIISFKMAQQVQKSSGCERRDLREHLDKMKSTLQTHLGN
uniref:Uncharacterized protein n=1 Tax=Timema monikensis TaxID=170555 RepID=A0A7R9E2P1_9NEOP|nr:unnamed protein product [Timema monikensis]